ncbi:MAG: hypothetical protein K8S87_02635 [Planctomycetes bacterium]|nr:hypothetical protein [Planctomycetota bacterium]
MLMRNKLILALFGFCIFLGCSTADNLGDAVSDNVEILAIAYSVGQSYLTTRAMLTEEETADGAIKIYKYDRYFTLIDALNSDGIPVAGRRKYEESFFEVSGQRSLKGSGTFQGKTIIFMPDSIPTVDGNPVDEKYSVGLRLTGFEHIFMPESVNSDGRFQRVELVERKERIMRSFLTQLGIVPDKSVISTKITESTEQNVKLLFNWSMSGIILGKKGIGVRLEFIGKITYSREHKGITYFELVRSSKSKDKSTLKLILNRDFSKIFENSEHSKE